MVHGFVSRGFHYSEGSGKMRAETGACRPISYCNQVRGGEQYQVAHPNGYFLASRYSILVIVLGRIEVVSTRRGESNDSGGGCFGAGDVGSRASQIARESRSAADGDFERG